MVLASSLSYASTTEGAYIMHSEPKYPLVKANTTMKMYGHASLSNSAYVCSCECQRAGRRANDKPQT